MAQLTVQNPVGAGITPSYVAAAGGGDYFVPDSGGLYLIHIKNGGGASITLTIDDPTSQSPPNASQFNPDVAVTVTNAQERMVLVDASRHKSPSTGQIVLTYSAVTSVTIGVFKLP